MSNIGLNMPPAGCRSIMLMYGKVVQKNLIDNGPATAQK